jgi:hypothetical protein
MNDKLISLEQTDEGDFYLVFIEEDADKANSQYEATRSNIEMNFFIKDGDLILEALTKDGEYRYTYNLNGLAYYKAIRDKFEKGEIKYWTVGDSSSGRVRLFYPFNKFLL